MKTTWVVGWGLAVGCHRADPADDAVLGVKAIVGEELGTLHRAARALQADAPEPADGGWTGAAALGPSRADWKDARVAYERVEGAVAVLFPDLDVATDERYDGFLAGGPDPDPFDGEGFTGVHAVERILWADAHPEAVVAFESGLPGYLPARFPADAEEAARYHDGLLQRLVEDAAEMEASFGPLALDPAAAYGGVVGSMGEQVEKVALAATGEDESRYAAFTLADMRANLSGGRALYAAFSPWIASADGGAALDAEVLDGFDRVARAYDGLPGDALPPVPEGWDPLDPRAEDLATDYGALSELLRAETDPTVEGSLVERLVAAADLVGLRIVP